MILSSRSFGKKKREFWDVRKGRGGGGGGGVELSLRSLRT